MWQCFTQFGTFQLWKAPVCRHTTLYNLVHCRSPKGLHSQFYYLPPAVLLYKLSICKSLWFLSQTFVHHMWSALLDETGHTHSCTGNHRSLCHTTICIALKITWQLFWLSAWNLSAREAVTVELVSASLSGCRWPPGTADVPPQRAAGSVSARIDVAADVRRCDWDRGVPGVTADIGPGELAFPIAALKGRKRTQ